MIKTAFNNDFNPDKLDIMLAETGLRLPYHRENAHNEGSYDSKMRSRYYGLWSILPVDPKMLVETFSQGITGGKDNLSVRDFFVDPIYEDSRPVGIHVSASYTPNGEYDDDIYLNIDREYDLINGKCLKGDVRSDNLLEKGLGRTAVRNSLLLGQDLGCNQVEISATRIGCLLWLKGGAYDITEVNPKYIDNITKRWEAIKPHVGEETDVNSIEQAITNKDLKKLASHEENIWSALTRTSAGAHGFLSFTTKDGGIPMNRYLLHDYMIDCWQGRSDMNNPQQKAELGKLLGGWETERPREEGHSLKN